MISTTCIQFDRGRLTAQFLTQQRKEFYRWMDAKDKLEAALEAREKEVKELR